MPKFVDLTNQRFERLVAKEVVRKNGRIFYKCDCDCGNTKVISANSLRTGKTRSCGCYNKEVYERTAKTRALKHGKSKSKLIGVHNGIKQRCLNPNNRSYGNYGARGITICDDWLDFKTFAEWAYSSGYEEGLTIERIDVNGNYEPSNCTWLTASEQSDNKQNTIRLEYKGKTQTLNQWAKEIGVSRTTLDARLRQGFPIEKVLSKNLAYKNSKLYTYNGKTQTLSQWAKEYNTPYATLWSRINEHGWTIEQALTISNKGKHKKIVEER